LIIKKIQSFFYIHIFLFVSYLNFHKKINKIKKAEKKYIYIYTAPNRPDRPLTSDSLSLMQYKVNDGMAGQHWGGGPTYLFITLIFENRVSMPGLIDLLSFG
jgi:hypothetical protein